MHDLLSLAIALTMKLRRCGKGEASVQATKNMREIIWMGPAIIVVIAIASSLSGCSRMLGQREDAVTDTGHRAAVLRLHQRTPLSNGCRYGLTLTNNLIAEIRDLALHFTAYSESDMRLQSVTRGFFGIKPTQQQFVEIRFAFGCSQIKRIEVGSFRRCIVGELTLRSAQPGDCLNLLDIRQSRFVELIKAADD